MTLHPFLARKIRPPLRPATEPWSTELLDPQIGTVRLTGRLLRRSSDEVVVVVHGLGGNCDSGYMASALGAADRLGRSCLLLNCRGADRLGSDVYHSGLAEDVSAALCSPELATFRSIDLLGYSIGGHIAYRYALGRQVDPRLRRVAAVGSPLDLRAAAFDFDVPALSLYRTHILDGLKEIYTAAYQRCPRGLSPDVARRIPKIVEWDEQIIAPRFGFQDAEHYYRTQSVGPVLRNLAVEALYVGATFDPMVRARAIGRYLRASSVVTVWEEQAGHLGFRGDFDLGMDAPLGLESQVLSWLGR